MSITKGLKRGFHFLSGAIITTVLAVVAAQAQTDLAASATAKIEQAKRATGVREEKYDFYARPPYRTEVPPPDDTLGYRLGTWHSTFRDQEQVLTRIANAATDRVRVIDYGKSVEGRPLRIYAIASPANIEKLEMIRQANLLLTNTPNKSDADIDTLSRSMPNIVWINECIHGGETASFESAMATLYTLAASNSPEVLDILQNTVVILNPVFNPDGHERFVVYFNAAATGSPDSFAFEQSTPWLVSGRFNHNGFDMNRDKIAQSQPETQAETREFLRWLPQVFVDQHGQVENYFFPPNAEATNPNVDRARLEKWTSIFGRANGAAFDQRGWSYVNRETFDLFYPGYLDSFTTLCGSIGMTYETDGGGNLAEKRADGTISSLRDASAHHFEAAMATIQAASKNHDALFKDFVTYRRAALAQTGRVIISPTRDPRRASELASLLLRLGIAVKETAAPLTINDAKNYETPDAKPGKRTFPAGSLVIDFGQAQGHLARAFLERETNLEPEFVKAQLAKLKANESKNENESGEGYDFYDTTAWSLPYIWGLDAAETNSKFTVATKTLALDANNSTVALSTVKPGGITGDIASATAFAIPLDTDNAIILGLRLLQSGYRVSVATRALTLSNTSGEKTYRPGTLFVRPARNAADVVDQLTALAQSLGVAVDAIPSAFGGKGFTDAGLGSQYISPLTAPKIAVAVGDGVSQTGYGSAAFTLRTVGVQFTPVSIRSLKSADTRRNFNVVLLPDGYGYGSNFNKEDTAALKQWIESGNCLVGLGGGATWLTNKDAGITSLRAVGDEDTEKDDTKTGGKSATPISLPGAIFRSTVRTDHFLGWGYPDGTLAVPLSGDTFWRKSSTGANVVTFPDKGTLRLSGFTWENNTEKLLAGTTYIADEPLGSGHAILFLNDPTDRALYRGLRRMFLSSLLFGTGR